MEINYTTIMKKVYDFVKTSAFLMLNFLFFSAQAQTPAIAPYSTSFESGTLDPAWTTYVQTANCEVDIYNSGVYVWSGMTANANTGTKFLGLHNAVGGNFETTHAALHLDMSGLSGFRLSFYLSEWNEEDHPEDGIFISDDGGVTYTEVFHYNGTQYTDLQYTHFDWSLDSINVLHNLSFNANYVIKIQQHDNFYFAGGNDGFLVDDVDVYPSCRTFSFSNAYLCGTYTVPSGDETYTTAGTVVDTIPNTAGCDSILYIDIVQGNSSATSYQFSCTGSYTAADGQVITTSGQYNIVTPNSVGCDSLITLYLIVGTPTSSSITESSCGPYTAPDGQVYSTDGVYTAVIQNSVGCDSTITIDLSVTPNSETTVDVTSCGPFVWSDGNTYNSDGVYTQVLGAANGCDSIVTLNLTMDVAPTVEIETTNNVDLEGTGATTYNWIDCADNTVVGTGDTFTPSANGSYAVIGYNGQFCSDTSECFTVTTIGISEEKLIEFNMYPNPATKHVSFEANTNVVEVTVFSIDGREVMRSNKSTIDVDGFAPSTYTVKVEFEGDIIITKKLMVK